MTSFDPNGIPEISLRQLRALVFVSQARNLSKAAANLNRSQTAVTKAINDLECTIGKPLFDRTATGMLPTAYGSVLANRAQRAMDEFSMAGKRFGEYANAKRHVDNIPIFSLDISYKRLSAFVALYQVRNIQRAAELLELTKAAIYSSVRQIEQWLDLSLFETEPNGVAPTPFCHVLAQHIKMAFAEIRHGLNELENIDGVTQGSIKVGTLPYTRTFLTPNAINLLLQAYPSLDISTQEGSYQAMESSLRSGEIDFIVGAIRPTTEQMDVRTEVLLEDKLAVIARRGHALMQRSKIRLVELMEYGWVLPDMHTPSGQLFINTMQNNSCDMPEHAVHTSSLSMVRGLLLSSDRVALLSEHQIHYDKKAGLLDVLPVEMNDTYRPIGVTLRRHTKPSPAAQLLLDKLKLVATQLAD